MRAHRGSTTLFGVAAVVAALGVSGPATNAAGELTCQDWRGISEAATIVGTDSDDVIRGTGGRDVVLAGAGNDEVDGGGGSDIICAGPGDDVVQGGDGTARGGPGNDQVTGWGHAYGGEGSDTLVGDVHNDNLVGGDGDDSLDGGAGHDNLVGGPGDDTIDGGSGSDFIAADPGNDHIDGGARATNPNQGGFYILKCGDWLYWASPQPEYDGEDVELWLEPGTTYKRAVTIDLADGTASSRATGHDTFTSIESATGTAVGDVIRGTVEADCLYGYGGGDRIIGRAGDDSLYSGRGSDSVDAGDGDDDVWLKSAAAHVQGGQGHDWAFWWNVDLIDLASRVVRGGALHGSIRGVEDVEGEYYRGPVIRGDAGANRLAGHRVFGRGGDDVLRANFADGGSGEDACSADRQVHCELELDVS